jgi:hypothetical protein
MAQEDDERVYLWIGAASAEERLEFGSVATIALGARDEELFEAFSADEGDSWDEGRHVGMVHITYHETPGGQMANVHATFDLSDLEGFEPGDTLAALGSLRFQDGVLTSGRLAITGGTGRFARARGQADVEHRNPHKYRVAVTTS